MGNGRRQPPARNVCVRDMGLPDTALTVSGERPLWNQAAVLDPGTRIRDFRLRGQILSRIVACRTELRTSRPAWVSDDGIRSDAMDHDSLFVFLARRPHSKYRRSFLLPPGTTQILGYSIRLLNGHVFGRFRRKNEGLARRFSATSPCKRRTRRCVPVGRNGFIVHHENSCKIHGVPANNHYRQF